MMISKGSRACGSFGCCCHGGTNSTRHYVDELLAGISKKDAEAWATGTPVDWANESVKVSRDVVYASVPADGPLPKLDQKYVDRVGDAIDLQLEKAGVRLAVVLNRAAPTPK